MERYLGVDLLGSGLSSYGKRIYRDAESQRLRNTLDEAAGDRFFHVTETNYYTMQKQFQPLVCGLPSVDRGLGITATLSVLFFIFSLG